MRFFRPKLPEVHDANQLRHLLLDAVRTGDHRTLADLCKTHQAMILRHFTEWTEVPGDIQNHEAVQLYANMLGTVADFFAHKLKKPELWQQLVGPADTNSIIQWQTTLKQAIAYIEELQYQEAVQTLSELLLQVRDLKGSAVDEYLPTTYGYLGESLFQSGEAAKAISPMETARILCEQQGDYDGVAAYEGNLYEIYRYLGQTEAAALCAGRLAQIFDKQGRKKEGAQYRKQAQQVRLGEPLNRVVARVDGTPFELADIQQIKLKKQAVQFEFRRNRISLRPAEAWIEQGEQLGRQSRFQDALIMFQNAAQADPYDPHCHYLAGLTLLNLQRYTEAIESYETTERLAPGWFNCRADLWLAKQLAQKTVPHDLFITLHKLEDWPLDPQEKIQLAKEGLAKMPNLAPLYLLYGKNLDAVGHSREAEMVYRKGITCVENPDVQTRLLLQLGMVVDSLPERQQLLQQARELNGNLVAAAMATFVLASMNQ